MPLWPNVFYAEPAWQGFPIKACVAGLAIIACVAEFDKISLCGLGGSGALCYLY